MDTTHESYSDRPSFTGAVRVWFYHGHVPVSTVTVRSSPVSIITPTSPLQRLVTLVSNLAANHLSSISDILS